MNIAVIGTGNVGAALASTWKRAGHQVTFGARDVISANARAAARVAPVATIEGAIRDAEAVLLATPWQAAVDLAATGELDGKLVVDATNSFGGLPAGVTSSAQAIAASAPSATVVKAFNSVGAEVMADASYAGGKPFMLYCTDVEAARAATEGLIADAGFEPVFLGGLANAHLTTTMAAIWMTAANAGLGRQIAFSLLRR